MANLLEDKERRVVPNWRSFGHTTMLGELNSFQSKGIVTKSVNYIDNYLLDWKLNKTVVHASDLLSAALVHNRIELTDVKDAAKFVLLNKHEATKSQISLAYQILNKNKDVDISAEFQKMNFDKLEMLTNPDPIRKELKAIKELLRIFPYNPILHVEMSRYYSILGQENNSIKSMRTALHLAPNNRFVLRSATRLFLHYKNDSNDYLEYIHNVLRKNPMTISDPWLTSAEISIATIRNRTSKFMKRGIELINSNNISPFSFTELASSIGTVELLNGKAKKSREFFNKALISPNDNSLAQLEWASTKDSQLNINPSEFNVKMNFEALALDDFHNDDYESALENAVKWYMDMPFSKRAIMFGSNLASSILKEQKKSISFLNAGLISHPNDPQLINNLAYALAIDDNPEDAHRQLSKIKNDAEINETTRICLTATKGLVHFRSGLINQGRQYYLEAIEKTKIINSPELNCIAILNYAREEIRVGSEYIEPIMSLVAKIPKESKDVLVRTLRNDVINMYEKHLQNSFVPRIL